MYKRNKSKNIEEYFINYKVKTENVKKDNLSLNLVDWEIPKSVVRNYKNKGMEKMFKWQADCLQTGNVLSGENLIYTAPTSAGKTFVAEMIMIKRFFETKKKCIIIQPFIAVVREKILSISDLLKDESIKVDGYMGIRSPIGGFKNVDIAVCSIEKANNLVNRLIIEENLNKIGLIIVDEVHLISDSHRGYIIELLLTKIMFFNRKRTTNIQIILMSATLPNPEYLSKWLDARVFTTDYRPIILKEMILYENFFYDNILTKIRKIESRDFFSECIKSKTIPYSKASIDLILVIMETILTGGGVLVFCPTKIMCEKLAVMIGTFIKTNSTESDACSKFLNDDKLQMLIKEFTEDTDYDKNLVMALYGCVSYHHAGLTMEERDRIENAFKSNILKVIFCTSTLSSGVNLPCQRSIIITPIFYKKMLDNVIYRQMAGRAGRKGIDLFGESILICKNKTEFEMAEKIITSDPNPVKSVISLTEGSINFIVSRILLEIFVSNIAKTEKDALLYIESMLTCSNLDKGISINLCRNTLDYLVLKNFLIYTENEIKPTLLAHAAVFSGLGTEESLEVFKMLCLARKSFFLENELHLIYLIVPRNIVFSWSQPNWKLMYDIWYDAPKDVTEVSCILGIKEYHMIKLSSGGSGLGKNFTNICKKFFISLAMMDILKEKPLYHISQKFQINRGLLQSLQNQTSVYAGMITIFCNRLKWNRLEGLLSSFQIRLGCGVGQELVDIVRISLINRFSARTIYNSGFKTVAMLYVGCSVQKLAEMLENSEEFDSSKYVGNSNKRLFGNSLDGGVVELTCLEAASFIINEAKDVLTNDFKNLGLSVNIDTLRKVSIKIDSQVKTVHELSSHDNEFLSTQLSKMVQQVENETILSDSDSNNSILFESDVNISIENSNLEHTKLESFNSISFNDTTINLSPILNTDNLKSISETNISMSLDNSVNSPVKFESYLSFSEDSNIETKTQNPKLNHVDHSLIKLKSIYTDKIDFKILLGDCLTDEIIKQMLLDDDFCKELEKSQFHSSNNVKFLTDCSIKEKSNYTVNVKKILDEKKNKDIKINCKNTFLNQERYKIKLSRQYIQRYSNLNKNNIIPVSFSQFNCQKYSLNFEHKVCMSTVVSIYLDVFIKYKKKESETESCNDLKVLCFEIMLENNEIYKFKCDNFKWNDFVSFLKTFCNKCQKEKDRCIWIFSDYRKFSKILCRCGISLSNNLIIYCIYTMTWLVDTNRTIENFHTVGAFLFSENLFIHMTKIYEKVQLLFYLFVNCCSKFSLIRKSILNLETNLLPVYCNMEDIGIKIMLEKGNILAEKVNYIRTCLLSEAFKLVGKPFNINNTQELSNILYNDLNLNTKLFNSFDVDLKGKICKNKLISTSKENLIILSKVHPLPKIIMSYRSITELLDKFLNPIKNISKENFLHLYTNYSVQNINGRIYIQNINLQNVQKAFEIEYMENNKHLKFFCSPRTLIVADNDYKIVTMDYKQLELRVLAHFCKDETLVNDIKNKHDVFKSIAATIYSIQIDQVNDAQRNNTKTMIYSLIYGCSVNKLASILECSVESANEYISHFEAKYPHIFIYKKVLIKTALENEGLVVSLAGRRSKISNLFDNNIHSKEHSERQIFNSKIQSSASDIVKIAMLKIHDTIKQDMLDIKMLFQVHDELVFEMNTTNIEKSIVKIKSIMENSVPLTVKPLVKICIGDNWGSVQPVNIYI